MRAEDLGDLAHGLLGVVEVHAAREKGARGGVMGPGYDPSSGRPGLSRPRAGPPRGRPSVGPSRDPDPVARRVDHGEAADSGVVGPRPRLGHPRRAGGRHAGVPRAALAEQPVQRRGVGHDDPAGGVASLRVVPRHAVVGMVDPAESQRDRRVGPLLPIDHPQSQLCPEASDFVDVSAGQHRDDVGVHGHVNRPVRRRGRLFVSQFPPTCSVPRYRRSRG